MSWAPRLTSAEPCRSITDELLESWVCWREACEDVGGAYERWGKCEPPDRGLAFKSYCAALDREEHAARIHSDWVERVRARAR